jgi:hypothetical protein
VENRPSHERGGWKRCVGYGFNVSTSRNQPLVLFAYETREAAEAAAQQVEAAVERAVLVRPFPMR